MSRWEDMNAAAARLEALRAEFPEWFIQHLSPERGGGFAARLGGLTVRARTLAGLEEVMRNPPD